MTVLVEEETPDQAPSEDAPYGYMTDPKTGEVRPRKKAGRAGLPKPTAPGLPQPGRSPSLEELKASGQRSRGEDREPDRDAASKLKGRKEPELPPFRAGPIARGVNRIYRRAGRIVKIFHRGIGQSIIECTRKEKVEDEDGKLVDAEDGLTVGEAWEEFARTRPRVRAALLKMLSGGATMQLVLAHAPILLAFLMTEAISSRFPLARFLEAWFASGDDDGQDDQDDGEAGGVGGLGQMFGMSPQDMTEAFAMMQSTMPGMFPGMVVPPRPGAGPRPPTLDGVGEAGLPR
jgi:hypothetical protein